MRVVKLFTGIVGLYFISFIIPSNELVYKTEKIEPVYREVITEVFAYTSSVEETDDNPWETASGIKPYNGSIACPRDIGFGTKIEIEKRIYVCEDRMNKRYKEEFDIWMPSKELAYNWGRRKVKVKIYF